MVNHYYFYGIDADFGPFFLKFCTYFPYNAKLCINGHEYVKRQLAKVRASTIIDSALIKIIDGQFQSRSKYRWPLLSSTGCDDGSLAFLST